MRHLLTVEETFELRGRGVRLGPSVPAEEADGARVEGELRTPGGEVLAVSIVVDEAPDGQGSAIVLGRRDVPLGSEVWIP